jgi:hypothetical protein
LTGAFGTDGARWDQYIASQQKIAKVAAEAGATVMLSTHSEYDGAYTRARLIGVKREPGESHPFIVGEIAGLPGLFRTGGHRKIISLIRFSKFNV